MNAVPFESNYYTKCRNVDLYVDYTKYEHLGETAQKITGWRYSYETHILDYT